MNKPFIAPRLSAPLDTEAAPANAILGGSKRPRHARSFKRFRAGRIVALALTGVLAFTGAGATTAALQLTGNIDAISVDDLFSYFERPERPVQPDLAAGSEEEVIPPLNILVLGTDGRNTAANAALGGGNDRSQRSDTAMIMNISGDRRHVTMVSIPRDSVVDIPACPTTTPGRYTVPRPDTRFNAAFAYGNVAGGDTGSGALCAMHTVEQLTNVRLDGFIAVDFNGFRNMVDALGGVEMCIPQAIHSPLAGGLRLNPGLQTLDGWTALQFARARTGRGLGDGSDISRIGRQQELLGAIALNVLSRNLLTDAPALLQFLGATTSSLTMSDNLASITGLAGLATSLQHIRPSNIEFITTPHKTNPENRNTVIWTPEAEIVWEALRTGTTVADVEAAIEAAALETAAEQPNGVYTNGSVPTGVGPGLSGIEAAGVDDDATDATATEAETAAPVAPTVPAAPAPRPTIATSHPAEPIYCS